MYTINVFIVTKYHKKNISNALCTRAMTQTGQEAFCSLAECSAKMTLADVVMSHNLSGECFFFLYFDFTEKHKNDDVIFASMFAYAWRI